MYDPSDDEVKGVTSGLNEIFQTASASVKTDTLMSLAAFRTSAKVLLHYCCSFTERYSKLLLPPNPPPLGGFHSSPITSSNDSNLSPRTCGLSKNGRHMGEIGGCRRDTAQRDVSATRYSQICKCSLTQGGWWGGGGRLQLGRFAALHRSITCIMQSYSCST